MLSLFYVNMALSLALAVAVIIIKPLKAYQRSLLGMILPSLIFQFILTLMLLGVAEKYQYLQGIGYPLQILQVLFLDRFFQAFTPLPEEQIKTPIVYWIALAFSILWYVGAHAVVGVTHLQYGLAHHPYNLGRYISSSILVIYTLKRIFKYLKCFKAWAEAHFSNIEKLRLPILYALTVYFLLSFIITIFDFITGPDVLLAVLKPFLFFVGIFGLVVYCLKTTDVLLLEVPEPTNGKLSPQEMASIQAKLEKVISVDRIYLNPELRLTDLAKAINERSYKVTWVLSRMIGKTFNDYINTKRVEHSKSLMHNPNFTHMNLVGIAMESGFNSKSVFNDVFKKMTGKTPSDFRKMPK